MGFRRDSDGIARMRST